LVLLLLLLVVVVVVVVAAAAAAAFVVAVDNYDNDVVPRPTAFGHTLQNPVSVSGRAGMDIPVLCHAETRCVDYLICVQFAVAVFFS
jgi:hypothetical protein